MTRVTTLATAFWVGLYLIVAGGIAQASNKNNTTAVREIRSRSVRFIPNAGQFDSQVRGKADLAYGTVWFSDDAVYYQVFSYSDRSDSSFIFPHLAEQLPSSDWFAVRTTFPGSNATQPRYAHQLTGITNYLIGDDPSRWITRVASFARVAYDDLYPNISLVYYSSAGALEYDFVVRPGADPSQIKMQFDGATSLSLDDAGHLQLETPLRTITVKAPVAYQTVDGSRRRVAAQFDLIDQKTVGFTIDPAYDVSRDLIIDPILGYSSLMGGTANDLGRDIGIDASGNAYVAMAVASSDFPFTAGYDPTYNGGGVEGYDAMVLKLSPNGDTVLFATYIGGTDGDEQALAIATDMSGVSWITGYTESSDFPTVNAAQSTSGGLRDAFVAKLTADGTTLTYSTYFGGSDIDAAACIDIDGTGRAVIGGRTLSTDFPTAGSPYAGTSAGGQDAFVAILSSSGSTVDAATYFGGSLSDYILGVKAASNDEIAVTGYTLSEDLPTANALDATQNGSGFNDALVARLSSDLSSLIFSTYLGGSADDFGADLDLNSGGDVVVTGYSRSPNFPTKAPYDGTANGDYDMFISSMPATGDSLNFSTHFGGSEADVSSRADIHSSGRLTLVGSTASINMPTRDPLDPSFNGQYDIAIITFSPAFDSLEFASFFGGFRLDYAYGIALSSTRDAYITGYTSSLNFPTLNSPIDTITDGFDLFVTKIVQQEIICVDSDGDGFGDPGNPTNECPDDNCPSVSNVGQEDGDGDGVGDACDNCPLDANAGQEDADGDGIGDVCDECTDTDGDGYGDPGFPANTCPEDNCPTVFNPVQEDADGDGIGDSCDTCTDTDGDGFGDPGYPANTCALDVCPDVYNPLQEDSDADGIGDSCDNCMSVANPAQEDTDADGIGDSCDTCTDTDGDGYGNPGFPANTCPEDNCPFIANPSQADADSNGIGDVCDAGCCVDPTRGNMDGDPSDVSGPVDLSYLVDFLFAGGPPPPCPEEANFDGIGGDFADPVDLSAMVEFLFGGGVGPAPCP